MQYASKEPTQKTVPLDPSKYVARGKSPDSVVCSPSGALLTTSIMPGFPTAWLKAQEFPAELEKLTPNNYLGQKVYSTTVPVSTQFTLHV